MHRTCGKAPLELLSEGMGSTGQSPACSAHLGSCRLLAVGTEVPQNVGAPGAVCVMPAFTAGWQIHSHG